MVHPEVTAQVRCQGTLHTIRHTARGRLVLQDHSLTAEAVALALGGASFRCWQVLACWQYLMGRRETQVLKAWQGWAEMTRLGVLQGQARAWLPDAFKPVLEAALQRQQGRHGTPLESWQQARQRRIEQAAREALERCPYRRAQGTWIGGQHRVQVRVGRTPSPRLQGYSEAVVQHRPGRPWHGRNSVIEVDLPLTWWVLHATGRSVIDGHFVLKALGTHPPSGVPLVLAARQGRGFALDAVCAAVVQGHLVWSDTRRRRRARS